jgi:hemerythrin superfamily protein
MFRLQLAARTAARSPYWKYTTFHAQKQYRYWSSTAINMSAISDAIKKDHREIEQYYQNILDAKDHDQATRWQNQFTWELARHSIAEELVVYPAFEKNIGQKGHEMAEKDRAEHQVVSRSETISLRD